jgi:hypothetical protein
VQSQDWSEDANSEMLVNLPDSIQNFLENSNQSSFSQIRDHTAQFGSVTADNMLYAARNCPESSNQSTVFEWIDMTVRFSNQDQTNENTGVFRHVDDEACAHTDIVLDSLSEESADPGGRFDLLAGMIKRCEQRKACTITSVAPKFVTGNCPESFEVVKKALSHSTTREVNNARDDFTDYDDSIADPDYVQDTASSSEDSNSDNKPSNVRNVAARNASTTGVRKLSKRSHSPPGSSALQNPDGCLLTLETVSDEESDVCSDANADQRRLLPITKKTGSGRKQVYDKTHFCTFCGAKIRSKIARHILTVHKKEEKVRDVLLLPKRSKERMRLLHNLSNEGNFKHNISVIRDGEGELIVGRRSALKSRKPSDYTVCEFCKKWQSKKNLWRHMKACDARVNYYANHPTGNEEDGEKKKRILGVKRGQELINSAVFINNDDGMAELMNRMRDGEVKSIVIADELIRHEAGLRMMGLGEKSDQKQDDVYRVSQAARTLGRIVLLSRQTIPGVSLDSLLEPRNFDLVVNVAKQMSTDKETPALNVGRTIGNLLRKVCDAKYCLALRNSDCDRKESATNFRKLVDTEWNTRVNRVAIRRQNRQKREKMHVIPLTEDLQTFRKYILRNMRELMEKLKTRAKPQDWVLLAKFTMSRLILFNKRRRAEVRELKVDEYVARPNWKDDQAGEMALALSPVDRLLAQR